MSILQKIKKELDEIRAEAKEAASVDDEVSEIINEAYTDTLALLEDMSAYEIPEPEPGWSDDGGLDLTWFPEGGLISIAMYGDGVAIYSIYFRETRQSSGIYELADVKAMKALYVTISEFLS